MTESIHGHEILEMLLKSEEQYTQDTLLEAIKQKFGADALFHTCSQENMTATELLTFLKDRQKIITVENILTINKDRICNHK